MSALYSEASERRIGGVDEVMAERTQVLLRDADRRGRGAEATTLLDSFLRWLEFHIRDRT